MIGSRGKTLGEALAPAFGGIVIALLAAILATACVTPTIEIGSPDLSSARDGAWRGYYDGGMVKVEVEVAVSAHRIDSITILKHECGLGKPAERIVGSIVEAQSLDVDVVSGASFSSRCILKAVELALAQASS